MMLVVCSYFDLCKCWLAYEVLSKEPNTNTDSRYRHHIRLVALLASWNCRERKLAGGLVSMERITARQQATAHRIEFKVNAQSSCPLKLSEKNKCHKQALHGQSWQHA